MANYNCVQRTNYFHVKDAEAFRLMLGKVVAEDFHFWEEKDEDGNVIFAFGCYGNISGIPFKNEEGEWESDGNESYEDFLEELQKNVDKDDAIILIESGYEKLRYVTSLATVITKHSIECLDLGKKALGLARKMLENEKYDPRMDY